MPDPSPVLKTAAETFVRSFVRKPKSRTADLCVLALERALIRDGIMLEIHPYDGVPRIAPGSTPIDPTKDIPYAVMDSGDDSRCRHVVDWVAQAVLNEAAWLDRTDREGRPLKLMKIGSVDRAVKEADKEMRRFASRSAPSPLGKGDETVEADLGDGWTVVRLASAASLDLESANMQHCIGQGAYDEKQSSGEAFFLSLRDPFGRPHVTLEVDAATDEIVQFKGKQNAPPLLDYARRIRPFVVSNYRVSDRSVASSMRIVVDRRGTTLDLDDLPDSIDVEGDLDLTHLEGRLPKEIRASGSVYMPRLVPDGIVDCEVHAGRNLVAIGGNAKVFARPLRVGGRLTLQDLPVESLHPDTRVGQDVFLRKLPNLATLPPGMACERTSGLAGDFRAEETGLVHLDGVVGKVGNLFLTDCRIDRLPDELRVGKSMRIVGCPLEIVQASIRVGGSVHLENCAIERIEANVFASLSVLSSFDPRRPGLTMGAGMRVKQQLNLVGVSMPDGLPSGLDVGSLKVHVGVLGPSAGNVVVHHEALLWRCAMEELPPDFDCRGPLEIKNCTTTSLGSRLRVGGWLEVENVPIRSIGDDVSLGKGIAGKLPELETIGRRFSIGFLDPDALPASLVLPEGMSVGIVGNPERFRGRLPEELHVKKDLDLSGFESDEIPASLTVGGTLTLPDRSPSFG